MVTRGMHCESRQGSIWCHTRPYLILRTDGPPTICEASSPGAQPSHAMLEEARTLPQEGVTQGTFCESRERSIWCRMQPYLLSRTEGQPTICEGGIDGAQPSQAMLERACILPYKDGNAGHAL